MQQTNKRQNKGKNQTNSEKKEQSSHMIKKNNLQKKTNTKEIDLEILWEKFEKYISKTFNADLIKDVKFYDACYTGFYLFFFILCFRYFYAIYALQDTVITNNVIINAVFASLPFVIWAFSTITDKYHFYNKKKFRLKLISISAILTLEQPIILLSRKVFVSKILEIEVTKNMTASMVVNLARAAMLIPMIIATVILSGAIISFYEKEYMVESIERFKINKYIDLRKNKQFKYDLPIFKNIKTGAVECILEWDRFVHTFINGQSGTGKTSSTMIPAIVHDLNIKILNQAKRHPLLYKMLVEKKAYIKKPYRGKITEYDIYPRKKEFKEELDEILQDYPDCGITVMAPNSAMNDTIIDACAARNINVNVIDPVRSYRNKKNVRKKGINNFILDDKLLFIDDTLSEEEVNDRIIKQAQDFSEVLVATNEAAGTSDQYFRDINTSVSTNIAIICMLAARIKGQQSGMKEVQNCINDFSRLAPMVQEIEEYYGINVTVGNSVKKSNSMGATVETVEKNKNASKKNSGENNPYFNIIQNVKKELLNPENDKMDDQSRGLRNLINKVMMDQKYANIFNATPENSINFDEALRKCEVTVINTAIERGSQESTMLGLTILLNLSLAVKRRPKDKRPYHFVYVDEASQYMHVVYEDMYELFRQYNVAITLAMQSISQMEKSKATAYLKNVIMGAGTQIVFGRVSAEEMKIYSELAGTVTEDMVQKTESSTSIFETNASQSYSERTTSQKKNLVESSDVRNREFQEVTVFKIKEGAVEPGFIGKCNFLDKAELKKRKVICYDFDKISENKKVLTKEAKKMVKETKKVAEEGSSKTTILVRDRSRNYTETTEDAVQELALTDEEVKMLLINEKAENELKSRQEQQLKEDRLAAAKGQIDNSKARDKHSDNDEAKILEQIKTEITVSEDELETAKEKYTLDNLIKGMFEDDVVKEEIDVLEDDLEEL